MNPGKPTVYVNTRFFDTMSKKKVCSNFAHEYCHTMGARHGGNMFRLSFAYYINTVIEKIYDNLYPSEVHEVKFKKVCKRAWYRFFIKKCYLVRE